MKRLASILLPALLMATVLLAALLCTAVTGYAQSGYISEVKTSFTGLNSLLPPSPILTPGPFDGDYLICTYVEQWASDSTGAALAWTDENGNPQSVVLVAPETGAKSGCAPLRNKANTATTIQATGYFGDTYSIYTVGFGFWGVGPDKQAGITEPISGDFANQTSTINDDILLYPTSYATYLLSLTLTPHSASDKVTASIGWVDVTGDQQISFTTCPGCATNFVFLVRSIPKSWVALTTTGTISDAYDLHVRGLQFGTPAVGTGPLSFYGHNFVDWVNAAYYNEGNVPAGMWLMSANAENASGTGSVTINGFPVMATSQGAVPGAGVAAVYEPAARDEWFYTSCGGPYTCQLYSAEFDLLIF
jgi:hypothetical protein